MSVVPGLATLRDLVGNWGALLRAEDEFAVGRGPLPLRQLVLTIVCAGFGYGLAMGSYAGAEAALYAALKVPLLVSGSMLICLPSFYVLLAVLGLAEDFSAACRGIVSAQSTLAVVLLALAPVTLLAYQVSDNYHAAKLLNGGMFALGAFGAQHTLARHYRPLLARDKRHRIALVLWPMLYFFVAAQLAYALRPFIGNPRFETQFLREDWMGNVYLDLLWALRGALG